MPEPSPKTTGDGNYGRAKRWTRGGTKAAGNSPWPKLFKRHESVLTGHLKMMDMIRNRYPEGSGNWETAKSCVDRTKDMIEMFTQATRNFINLPSQIDRLPLGTSSASIYPGYPPALHVFDGEVPEYDAQAAGLKRSGEELELDPSGPQGKNRRRSSLESKQAESKNSNGQGEGSELMEGIEKSTNESQYFVIDSNPTPVPGLGGVEGQKNKANHKAKRRRASVEEQPAMAPNIASSDAATIKKRKTAISITLPSTRMEPVEQGDDITAEVEARVKAKEEKRKRREEKKRKRESEEVFARHTGALPAMITPPAGDSSSIEIPKKKKHKKEQTEISEVGEAANSTKQDNEHTQAKKSPKRAQADEQISVSCVSNDGKRPHKKRKKEATLPI